MNSVTLILSTGRCGTQWIATMLARHFGNVVDVAHEPLGHAHETRKLLGLREVHELPANVAEHFQFIESKLTSRSYIECGHPAWSSVPLLAKQFADRFRVVHLVRHPVSCCHSWLSHGAYQPPLLPHIKERVLLTPFDAGVKFSEYQSLWGQMTPFEKCLYYWTEVNALGLEWESSLNLPWLRLKYEDLFEGEGLNTLLSFLDLPLQESIVNERQTPVDRFHYHLMGLPDSSGMRQFPHLVQLVEKLGYRLDAIDDASLARRYSPMG